MSGLDIFANPQTPPGRVTGLKSGPLNFTDPVSGLEQAVEGESIPNRSFKGLWGFLVLTVALLTFQCYQLQIKHGHSNQALSEGNSVRILTQTADRGLITDFSGTVLAQNSRQIALAINPQTLPVKPAERQEVYRLIKEKAGLDEETMQFIERNRLKSGGAFVVKQNLSKEESLLFQEWFANLPGVVMLEVPIRHYADLPSLGHILGYVGPVDEDDLRQGYTMNERIGKSGVEKTYNPQLQGQAGKVKAVVNAFGEVVPSFAAEVVTPVQAGSTLRLSIDSRLQNIAAQALRNEMERRTKKYGELKQFGGSIVVLDPATGAVRAMVSLPDYNNNWFGQGITTKQYEELLSSPANPLLNRAIAGQFPPGSTIKPLIASAGLQAGVITARTEMVTPEAIYIGQFRFPDWKTHGLTNTRKAIAESNDIFFYAVGGGWEERKFRGLGIESLNRYLGEFGLGQPTGIDLDGEAKGLLGNASWKRENLDEPWYIGDTYHASIGQGFTLATPLQMAAATAVIANGGTLWKPQLGWSVLDPETQQETLLPHTVLRKDFIAPHHLQTVREGMRQTVESGSARPLNTLKVKSAGKTGTSEFNNDKKLTHAWYTGFAPYENPELVFAILIEAGGDSYESSVPVAEEILRGYFNEPLAPGQKLTSEPNLVNAEFRGER
jgi:penicillin-binding protein 2